MKDSHLTRAPPVLRARGHGSSVRFRPLSCACAGKLYVAFYVASETATSVGVYGPIFSATSQPNRWFNFSAQWFRPKPGNLAKKVSTTMVASGRTQPFLDFAGFEDHLRGLAGFCSDFSRGQGRFFLRDHKNNRYTRWWRVGNPPNPPNPAATSLNFSVSDFGAEGGALLCCGALPGAA